MFHASDVIHQAEQGEFADSFLQVDIDTGTRTGQLNRICARRFGFSAPGRENAPSIVKLEFQLHRAVLPSVFLPIPLVFCEIQPCSLFLTPRQIS